MTVSSRPRQHSPKSPARKKTLPTVEAWCANCYGKTLHLLSAKRLICSICSSPFPSPAMPSPVLSDRFQLAWSEIIDVSGRPGRKHRLIGRDSFPAGSVADLLVEAERKLLQGYRIEILPPSGRTVDEAPSGAFIDILAA